MKSRYIQKGFFKKYYSWFERPFDVADVSIATFFCYESLDIPGFTRTELPTTCIDVTKPTEEIWEGLRKKFIREQIDHGLRRGIQASLCTDIQSFYNIYTNLNKRLSLPIVPLDMLSAVGIVFVSEFNGLPVSGAAAIGDGHTLRLWIMASERLSSNEILTKQLIGEANRIVLWSMIVWAKEQGYKRFDLGGVESDGSTKKVQSIATFKEGFGGEHTYSYYYQKVYSPVLRFFRSIKPMLIRFRILRG